MPEQFWWSAAEIAMAALPDLSATRQGVEAQIKRFGWKGHPEHARKRKARGGGWEYSWKLFPLNAQKRLITDATPVALKKLGRKDAWAFFEALPDRVKAKAQDRLRVIGQIDTLVSAGQARFMAVSEIAGLENIGERTIWNWLAMIQGVRPDDRLPYLAPRHRASARKVVKAACSRRFMDLLKGDFLRLAGPSFVSAYERVVEICKVEGKAYLALRTARRRFNEEVPRVTQIFARKGEAGLASCFPPQIRDRTQMVAMEGVEADCHKMDVFVQWPGENKPARAQIVAFKDIYSGMFLAWRVDSTPNKVAVMAAFGDMIEEYGIPQHCLFDNGTEFANKWLTGGTPTRFRFKIRNDDPLGVLPMLGIKIHWATPGHGQAKPIERSFRDFADHIAKDPRFDGAYTGNKPDAKPEDYGSRAIPIAEFVRVVGEGIARHNARLGRLSPTAKGRSFDETFAESYATAPISKATDEQRRLWLMAQATVKLHKTSGQISLHGNKYWADWINEYAGTSVVARFDPEDLHSGLHIYDLEGAYMGYVACEEAVGFFDLVGAREHARKTSAIKRTERKLLQMHRSLKPRDVAAALDAVSPAEPAGVEAKVVRMLPNNNRPDAARVSRPVHHDVVTPKQRASQAALVADFRAEKVRRDEQAEAQETPRQMFQRALEIERRSEVGARVGEAEVSWLQGFKGTPIYRSERILWEDFGDNVFLK